MRSLHPDSSYFEFLDALCANQAVSVALIPSFLVREFPTLRAEEAKAIYADWYAQHRKHRDGKGAGGQEVVSLSPDARRKKVQLLSQVLPHPYIQ